MNVNYAVKVLAVLSAIPVAIFALWADYFSRALEKIAQENPFYDRATELAKVRVAGVCAIFFQFGIFAGTGPLRNEAPVLANLVFVAGILLVSIIQGSLEHKLRKPQPRLRPVDTNELTPQQGPVQEAQLALRAFFWATTAGALYLAGFALPVVVGTLIAKLVHASPQAITGVVILSGVLGMIGGVGLNFALGAFYLRRMLPVRELDNEKLKSQLEACFTNAGLVSPTLWVVETGRRREGTAMLAGFPGGRGVFKPGLFLSRGLLDVLTDEEVRAVVLHEVSHLKLQHLKKRLLYSVGLVVATTSAATFCVFLANVYMHENTPRDFIGFTAAGVAFFLTFRMLGTQSRAHETEADFHSIEKLQAGQEELISALRKLDIMNGRAPAPINPLSAIAGKGHPSTEVRVAAISARFGTKGEEVAPVERDRAA